MSRLAHHCGFSMTSTKHINTAKSMKFFLQDTNIWMTCPRCDVQIDEEDYIPYPEIYIYVK